MNEKDRPAPFTTFEFWSNLLFKRGILAVAEVAGTMFLFRAVISFPNFSIAAAATGSVLVIVGVIFEYLIWTKTTVFASRQIELLMEDRKRTADEIRELRRLVQESRPGGAGALASEAQEDA